MLFSTAALSKLLALRPIASRPSAPRSDLLDLDPGDATAMGCARRKLACFKLRAPAFAVLPGSNCTDSPAPSNSDEGSSTHVGSLLPPHQDTWHSLASAPPSLAPPAGDSARLTGSIWLAGRLALVSGARLQRHRRLVAPEGQGREPAAQRPHCCRPGWPCATARSPPRLRHAGRAGQLSHHG